MPEQPADNQRVVEFLTFTVDPSEQAEWLRVEESTWSRFLETQPGFIRKEIWRSETNESQIHAVVWWESMDAWKAIGPKRVAEIDAQMGKWLREPTMTAFSIVRDC